MAFPLKSHLRRRRIVPHVSSVSWLPTQIAHRYNLPNNVTGKGVVIGVIELGGAYSAADHAAYNQQLGLPAPNVVPVLVDGATQQSSDADGEVMLDVEIIGAIAPGAQQRLYFAPNTSAGFLHAIQKARADGCTVISISWGGPEDTWAQTDLAAFNAELQTCANAGINVFVAAGDNGSGDGETGVHVDFPASAAWSIGVGGTNTPSSGQETVWNDGSQGGATGGGFSTVFTRPPYQPINSQGTGRMVPDVAANADPNTGFSILIGGQVQTIGGTSAGAPLWAGLTALLTEALGKNPGFLAPFLYGNPGAFVDIVTGNNGQYQATPGIDPCTGLGRPDGGKLLAALAGAGGGTPPPPPPPPPPPTQPAKLFSLTFPRVVPQGGYVRFKAPLSIPAGKYDVVPEATTAAIALEIQPPVAGDLIEAS